MGWKLEDLSETEFKATLEAVHDFDKVEAQQWELILKQGEALSALRRLVKETLIPRIERLENEHHE